MKANVDVEIAKIWLDHGVHIPSRTILLSGDIEEPVKRTVLLGKSLLDASNVTVTVQLDTLGGDIYEAFSIFDCLKSFQARVEIVGFGKIWSMGAMILQAADEGGRLLMPHSTVLVHQGYSGIEIDHPETLQRTAKEDKRIRSVVNKIFGNAIGLNNQNQARIKWEFDTYYSAEQAVAAGLADRVLMP